MKMYVWSVMGRFVAVAQADSVEAARKAMLVEMGESGDDSCPERDKARQRILNTLPGIWYGVNAEFALTDSAELIEQEAETERWRNAVASLEERAAFGDQCYQDRCENALIEASVVKRIEACNQRLYAALKRVEWAQEEDHCPDCGAWQGEDEQDRQHSPACMLKSALVAYQELKL